MEKFKVLVVCPNCENETFTTNEHDEYVCIGCKSELEYEDLKAQQVYVQARPTEI